jgi:hypothetical protein
MRFAFRIGNHFRFSDRAAKDFRGYDAYFGALIVKRYLFRHPVAVNALMAPRQSAVSPTTGEGWKLLRQQRCWSFHHGDVVLHRLLHLLERTRAYLAHALARDAELVGRLVERDRFFGEPTRLEDAPLTLFFDLYAFAVNACSPAYDHGFDALTRFHVLPITATPST